MNISDLKKRVIIASPFSKTELKNDILEIANMDSLSLINKYLPKIIHGYYDDINIEENQKRNLVILKSYEDPYTAVFQPYSDYEVEIRETGTVSGHCTAQINWTLKDIDTDPEIFQFFIRACVAFSSKYMANNRRSAVMEQLPFDIKGDQFYNEAEESLQLLEIELQNSVRNTL